MEPGHVGRVEAVDGRMVQPRGVAAAMLGGYDKADNPSERLQKRVIAEARRLLAQFKARQRRGQPRPKRRRG